MAMIQCAVLMAGLLGPAHVSQGAREGPVIYFRWQPVEKWQVEIRGYLFHRGAPPRLPPGPWKIEVIESHYREDLRAAFEQVKKQKP
jgi:hypothetical protein